MDSDAPPSSGLLGAVRSFADGVLGSIHDRIELLAVELQEEKHRLVQIFVWISALVFLAGLALIFASFAIVVAFWETARVAAVSIVAGVYLASFVAVLLAFRAYLKRQTRPFSGTLNELRQDRACIRPEN